MNVGDLVKDWELGLSGIVVEHHQRSGPRLSHFSVLYEDGEVGDAYEHALEVINAGR
jgi:hypothetical protein